MPTLYIDCAYKYFNVKQLENKILVMKKNVKDTKNRIIQKRIKLDNGKTVIVDYPAKSDGKNPFEEIAGIMSTIPNLKPCD